MIKYVIIVAGGSGKRMGGNIPKQFLLLRDKPVLMHSIEKFYQYDQEIQCIVVLPEQHAGDWDQLCRKYTFTIPHQIVKGGETRFHSVQNGLVLCKGSSLIAIHDAVRPLVSLITIDLCFMAAEEFGSAIPVIQVTDSLRKTEGGKTFPVNRDHYKVVQTPQIFSGEKIIQAYSQPYMKKFTDDASVFEASGHSIHLVDGDKRNIKITTREDLHLAEFFFNI